jgi:hypothetical protein
MIGKNPLNLSSDAVILNEKGKDDEQISILSLAPSLQRRKDNSAGQNIYLFPLSGIEGRQYTKKRAP